MNAAEIKVRRWLCETCPQQCTPLPDVTVASFGCPLSSPRFSPAREHRKPVGLGDVVAAIAQPIARSIDAVAGTKVAECGGCKKRREALNRIAPRIMP